MESERLLGRANLLLEEVIAAAPYDLGGIAEKAFLLLELGQIAEAAVMVEGALASQAFAPDLLALRVHIARFRLSGEGLLQAEAILFPLKTLERLFNWASPMVETLAIRCRLSLKDGESEALARLGPFYRRVLDQSELNEKSLAKRNGVGVVTYDEWIADELNDSFFAGFTGDDPTRQLPRLRSNLELYRPRLDELEESFIIRLRAVIEPVLPISI